MLSVRTCWHAPRTRFVQKDSEGVVQPTWMLQSETLKERGRLASLGHQESNQSSRKPVQYPAKKTSHPTKPSHRHTPTQPPASPQHFDPDERITLDVGGTLFTTTRATLTKDPESMLGKMFSANSKWNTEQCYFLDCDDRYFRVILNYLRYDELFIDPNLNSRGILTLARYLQISGLIALLEEETGEKWVTVVSDDFSAPKLNHEKWKIKLDFHDSQIKQNIFKRLCFVNRATIMTVQQYEPVLRIRGYLNCTDKEDSFHLFTRCDGIPSKERQCMGNGLEFFVMRNRCAIGQRGDGPQVTACYTKTEGKFNFLPNRLYAFEIIDAISQAQITVRDCELNTSICANIDPSHISSYNFIAMYNREKTGDSMVSYVSNLSIQQWDPIYPFNLAELRSTHSDDLPSTQSGGKS